MRICCFSDCHGYMNFDIPEADLYLIAGDMCPVWNHTAKFQLDWLHNEFKSLLERLGKERVFWVGGNHDLALESHQQSINSNLLDNYLFDSVAEFKGLKIYGTPWQPVFCDWAFNLPEEELKKKWELIPNNIDILLLHAPPYLYGDAVPSRRDKKIRHTGSPSLLEKIKEIKPKLVVVGHIHCDNGIFYLDNTVIVNCSVLDDDYKFKNKPKLLEIKEGNISILSV